MILTLLPWKSFAIFIYFLSKHFCILTEETYTHVNFRAATQSVSGGKLDPEATNKPEADFVGDLQIVTPMLVRVDGSKMVQGFFHLSRSSLLHLFLLIN